MTSTTILLPSPQTELSLFQTAYALELARLQRQARTDSVSEAERLATAVVRSQWDEHHWACIRVACALTMPELRDIGRWRRRDGTRACKSLVRAPFIHDQVAERLWEYLAACQGRRTFADEVDEQEEFERETAARWIAEEETMLERENTWVSDRGVVCDGRARKDRWRLPSDRLDRLDTYRQTKPLDDVLWQKEDTACPCQKTYDDMTRDNSSDGSSSDASTDRRLDRLSSPSASTFASSRSSLSKVFTWGKRS